MAAFDANYIKVSIIILNWNGKRWLKNCLTSILLQEVNEPFEVLLVDNGSTDDSAQYVRKRFPQVRVIELGKNYGFAEGNNRGAAYAQGEYLIFVNNDTIAENGWLKNLLKAAYEYPSYQILCSIQLPVQKENRAMSLDCFGDVTITQQESSRRITDSLFASGACFLARREWVKKLGYLFDPYYFFGVEDVEMSLRTILMGGLIGYVRDSKIHHHIGGSQFPSFWGFRFRTRNWLLTYYKLFTPKNFARMLLVHLVCIAARIGAQPKEMKWILGMVIGLVDFFIHFRRYKKYRIEFMRKKKRQDEYIFTRFLCEKSIQRALRFVFRY
jgi:hypothetical protein